MLKENNLLQLESLVQTLTEMRDAWAQLSVVLKDHLAELPSPLQQEVQLEVEQLLTNMRLQSKK